MKKRTVPKFMTISTEQQRRAMSSPQRMELLGLFVEKEALSVAQMAERVGRPATALHYHVGVLEKAGILVRAGEQRSGKRPEALYHPAAEMFRMEQERDDAAASEMALKTMASAFRMAEGDMRAAFTNPASKSEGPYRNVFGARLHCRISKKQLAELNRHLRAIEKMLSRREKPHEQRPNDQFVSLTLALMPLRNREVQS